MREARGKGHEVHVRSLREAGDAADPIAAKLRAEQPRQAAVGERLAVTFAGQQRRGGERQVPEVSEQRAAWPAPQPMRALPAHPRSPRRRGHAASVGERRQESDLPLSRPAVGANAMLRHRGEQTQKGGRVVRRDKKNKIVWVSPGIIFPVMKAMSALVDQDESGEWALNKPSLFKPDDMIRRAVAQFRRS